MQSFRLLEMTGTTSGGLGNIESGVKMSLDISTTIDATERTI